MQQAGGQDSERHSNCKQPGSLHQDIQLFMPMYGELDDGERAAWLSLLRMHLPRSVASRSGDEEKIVIH